MSRLINADALEKDGWMMHRTVRVDKDTMSYQTKKPTDFPTIEERKTGHWILHPEQEKNIFGVKTIECSECGDKCLVQFVEKEKYCRNCGAKMEEGGQE